MKLIYDSKFNRQWRTGALFCLLMIITAVLLTSCRSAGSMSQEKRDVTSFLSFMQISTQSGQGALYEITQLTDVKEGGILCCTGLSDETHLLLLIGNTDEDGNIHDYSALLLDLRNGETQESASFNRTQIPGDRSDGSENLSILSCDPLIVHDSRNGIIYRPEGNPEAVVLPEFLKNAEPYWMDSRLLLSGDRGILCEVTQDGGIRAIWTLPYEYGAFTPVVAGHEGRLTFATYSRRNPSLQVYVDVAPGSGESEYYLSDINPSRFTVTRDGLLLGTSFRTTPAVSVCDPSEHVKKEIELPDEILSLLSADGSAASPGSEEDSFLGFSTFPLSLCADWCSWALNDSSGRPVHIYLWDTASCRSVSWDGPSVSEYTAPETFEYGELDTKAKALENKYGVRIVFGENIPTEFADYSAEPFTNEFTIDGSLSVLENVLSLYPDNYFTSLKGNYYRDIVFYLTGSLKPLNSDSNITNAGGFATESAGTMQIAFDLNDDLSPDMVIHELTHAADYRFAGEGILDEKIWNSMNPEGFNYYYSYINEYGESYETAGSLENTAMGGYTGDDVWFIDPYSKTFPMEDRARLMENLLSGRTPYADCFESPHIQEKLSWYFRFLRETLDDGSWPDATAWEESLAQPLTQASQ